MAEHHTTALPEAALHAGEFGHISRHFDVREGRTVARLLPGEYYVTAEDELITTVLGSCVSACIRDPVAGIGGMNHFMLPATSNPATAWDGALETRFGVAAMEQTINALLKRGACRTRLEFKLFGGGKVIQGMDAMDVGHRNIEFARQFIRREGFRIAASDLGGPFPRKVHYYPQSGRVLVRPLRGTRTGELLDGEIELARQPARPAAAGSIELF